MAAHGGGEGKNAMLQLFEGYLERKVLEDMDEAAYDHVREGAVVFLGTLARHLEPSGPKVRPAGADEPGPPLTTPPRSRAALPRAPGPGPPSGPARARAAGARHRGDAGGGAGHALVERADGGVGLPDAAHARPGGRPRLHRRPRAGHAQAPAAGPVVWRQVGDTRRALHPACSAC